MDSVENINIAMAALKNRCTENGVKLIPSRTKEQRESDDARKLDEILARNSVRTSASWVSSKEDLRDIVRRSGRLD